MALADIVNGRIVVTTDYREKDLIRAVPGALYDTDAYKWWLPMTWAACKALRGVFGDRLELTESLIAWAEHQLTEWIRPALTARVLTDAPGDPDLYPFQRAGVQFLATAERALLCDEMGTGKTVQAIRTLAELVRRGHNPFPCLVICPNSMKLTWKAEFARWWPGVETTVVKGSATQRRKQIEEVEHVLIMNWEQVRHHSRLAPYGSIRLRHCNECDPTIADDNPQYTRARCERCRKELNLRPWITVIADEAHRIKDPAAKQTRAVWATVSDQTRFRFCLTGTPIANNPIDMWPAMHLIDIWGTKNAGRTTRSAYIDRYCATVANAWSGGITVTGLRPENREEFYSILDPQMRRMPKEAVLPFLPRKTYITRRVEMHAKQAKAYKQMENDLVAQLDSGILVAVNPLVQLTRLTQFAAAYAELQDDEVRLLEPSCKVDDLMELLAELVAEPLVVFAQSRQLIDLAAVRLTKAGISFGLITGGQNADERQATITSFQDGRIRCVLATIAAGGVGITLTRSAYACFLQRSWSMVDNLQAEDRVHRIGSEIHDKITIIDIVAIDTVEDRVAEVFKDKQEQLEEIVRDRAFLRSILDRD